MNAARTLVIPLMGLVLAGCQLLPTRPAGSTPESAATDPAPTVCPGLPAFAATVADYSALELQTAAEGLGQSDMGAAGACDQARLALLQARPGHGGFAPEAAEQQFAQLLDGSTELDRWTRRFLVSSRDTLAAWMEQQRALKERLLVLEQTVDTRERTIREMQDQIDALTSIERSTDRGFD